MLLHIEIICEPPAAGWPHREPISASRRDNRDRRRQRAAGAAGRERTTVRRYGADSLRAGRSLKIAYLKTNDKEAAPSPAFVLTFADNFPVPLSPARAPVPSIHSSLPLSVAEVASLPAYHIRSQQRRN